MLIGLAALVGAGLTTARPVRQAAMAPESQVQVSPVAPDPVAVQPGDLEVWTTRFVVPADHWIATGITLKAGTPVWAGAEGHWNPWKGVSPDLSAEGLDESNLAADSRLARAQDGRMADRICDQAAWGALVGRIGNGPAFCIGEGQSFVANRDGELSVGMNDDFSGGATQDNTGALEVTVTAPSQTDPNPQPTAFPLRK